jgi:hypothetical protein
MENHGRGPYNSSIPQHTSWWYTAGLFWKRLIANCSIPSYSGSECVLFYTANEGLVRIQYKCLVLIDVFPEMKLRASLLPKQNYNVLSPNFHTHVSVSDNNSRIRLPICSQIGRFGRIWERGRSVSFLGIHKSDFWYSVQH